jgi:hypothetical protein
VTHEADVIGARAHFAQLDNARLLGFSVTARRSIVGVRRVTFCQLSQLVGHPVVLLCELAVASRVFPVFVPTIAVFRLLSHMPLRSARDSLRILQCFQPQIAELFSILAALPSVVDWRGMLVRRPADAGQVRPRGRFLCGSLAVSFYLTRRIDSAGAAETRRCGTVGFRGAR